MHALLRLMPRLERAQSQLLSLLQEVQDNRRFAESAAEEVATAAA